MKGECCDAINTFDVTHTSQQISQRIWCLHMYIPEVLVTTKMGALSSWVSTFKGCLVSRFYSLGFSARAPYLSLPSMITNGTKECYWL